MIETARHEDSIFRITLNRPEKRNALSLEMCRQLVAAFAKAAADRTIRVVVLTANGTSFCSGMDLHELADVDLDAVGDVHKRHVQRRQADGEAHHCRGARRRAGGRVPAWSPMRMWWWRDPRVAFGLTEIKIGLWPFLIYKTVAEAIGDRRATEWSLTGRVVDVEEAKAAGLVHRICKNPYDSAFEIARGILASSQVAVSSGLGYIQQSRGKTWQESGRMGHALRNEVMTSAEFAEGLKAFREKRKKPQE